jgi:glycerol-3-phosphate dehydrogenase
MLHLLLGQGSQGLLIAQRAQVRVLPPVSEALPRLRVALIDKGDFASDTSSISSKLVHGSLVYLDQADIPLVNEALHERALLLRNGPHLVHPL